MRTVDTRTVVCEFSGGADSTLAGVYARKKYRDANFIALFVNYGQSYFQEEREASARLMDKVFGDKGIWYEVCLSSLFGALGYFSQQVFRQQHQDVPIAQEFFPMRNLVIGTIAASVAVQAGADVIVNGSKSLSRVPTDPYSFRDSTLPFYKMMEAAINAAMEEGRITIDAILADGRSSKMTKVHVFKELLVAGIHPEETWSCYSPNVVDRNPCSKCRNCVERKELLMTWQPNRKRD